MRIAITGASGFIGQEVVRELADIKDVDIIALSRHSHAENDTDTVSWRRTDYSSVSLKNMLCDVDVVIHLAAVRGTAGTLADYSINEYITENLLIAAGECGIRRIVFASTIAVYSDTSSIPWTEKMMLTPKTLYGITKAACEHLCQYYSRKYGFRYSIVRIAQVLGTGEKRRVMTNVFMESASRGEQLHVIGRSRARRQYIYSRDVARILVRLSFLEEDSVIVNAGMEDAYTNLEIARMVNEVYGNETPVDYDDSTEETIEPSFMSTGYYHTLFQDKLLSMREALEEIARKRDKGIR